MENVALVGTPKIMSFSQNLHAAPLVQTNAAKPVMPTKPSTNVSFSQTLQAAPLVQAKATKPVMPAKPSTNVSANDVSLPVKFASAGLAACFADVISFPFDTAKVRLQVQGEAASAAGPQYRGLVGTMMSISRKEGPKALYNGLVPGLQRQLCFASVRIGLYDTVKQFYGRKLQAEGADTSVGVRLLAGGTTGAMAVTCAQPTDVVKTRMQAQVANAPTRYTGVFMAYKTIAMEEGVRGLWKGMFPNIARNSIVTCSELVTYDLIKDQILKRSLLSDSLPCHVTSAFGAGFCTTLVASPVDVVKTRFMNSAAGTYSGVINCAVQTFKKEGAKAFYKGFVPSFMRIAVWNITMFVCFEQLKKEFSSISAQKLPQLEWPLRHKHFTLAH